MLNFLSNIFDLFLFSEYWRLWLCLLISFAICALIYSLAPSNGIPLISILIVGPGAIIGVLWQHSANNKEGRG
jgi:flagellar biosynthesis protein FliR